ncbi:protein of unassigned function [Methylobacterium oryzae CBMB20]|uniref:Protein of unassigned function n=1 Tax=Methylobacterium oryzae CBMB20 TaxID=693986 RepID=A0A089QBT6_9HYPH|nr:protein of unassigned function [Methylobacterium oryzae CBMB20]
MRHGAEQAFPNLLASHFWGNVQIIYPATPTRIVIAKGCDETNQLMG